MGLSFLGAEGRRGGWWGTIRDIELCPWAPQSPPRARIRPGAGLDTEGRGQGVARAEPAWEQGQERTGGQQPQRWLCSGLSSCVSSSGHHRGHHCSVLVTPGTRAGGQKSSAPVLIPQSTSKTLHVQQRRKRQAGSGMTPNGTTRTPDRSQSVPMPYGDIITAMCERKVQASKPLQSSRSQPVGTPAHKEDAREGTGKSRAHAFAALTSGDRVRRGR